MPAAACPTGEAATGSVSLLHSYAMTFDLCGTGRVVRRGKDPRASVSYLPIIDLAARTSARVVGWRRGHTSCCAHCLALTECRDRRPSGASPPESELTRARDAGRGAEYRAGQP